MTAAQIQTLLTGVEVGELVGRGRTSDVYAYGRDSVVKVAHDYVPPDWPTFEAALTQAVWTMGVPAPEVRDVVTVHGRPSVVFERITGQSMWQQIVHEPSRAPALARELATIQRSLMAIGIPPVVPELTDRLIRKIREASGLAPQDRDEAIALVQGLPRGAALLHGDLHPGNVLVGRNGPIVIDWFDATIGHPVADIVRSSILMQPSELGVPWHLPGATSDILRTVRQTYLSQFRPDLGAAAADLACWQGVIAAGRLAEEAEADEQGLLALWNARTDLVGAQSLLVD